MDLVPPARLYILHIGNGNGVVVLSDMEKGIDNAVASLLPQASHGLCLFHIEKNFVKRFHTDFNGILWKAAPTTTLNGFNSHVEVHRGVSPKAAEHSSRGAVRNGRAVFNGRRFGTSRRTWPSRQTRSSQTSAS